MKNHTFAIKTQVESQVYYGTTCFHIQPLRKQVRKFMWDTVTDQVGMGVRRPISSATAPILESSP